VFWCHVECILVPSIRIEAMHSQGAIRASTFAVRRRRKPCPSPGLPVRRWVPLGASPQQGCWL
jgi:hypothetical protein